MVKAVLDTSVFVSALRSNSGASNEILQMLQLGVFAAACSPALFLEYEDVLKRPEQQLVHGLNEPKIDRFLNELALLLEPVEVRFSWRPQIKDPNDEMVLEAAINSRADFLVTHNVRDFASVIRRFDLKVVTPSAFLKELI